MMKVANHHMFHFLFVDLDGGSINMNFNETSSGLSTYTATVTVAQINDNPKKAIGVGLTESAIDCGVMVNMPEHEEIPCTITSNADSRTLAQDLTIMAYFTEPIPSDATPEAHINYENMLYPSYDYDSTSNYQTYYWTINDANSRAKHAVNIEIKDDMGNVMCDQTSTPPTDGPYTGTISILPSIDPPNPMLNLNVDLQFSENINFDLNLKTQFEDGSWLADQIIDVSSSPGNYFTVSYYAANLTDFIKEFKLYDDADNLLQSYEPNNAGFTVPHVYNVTTDTGVGANEIKLLWDTQSEIEGYIVYWSETTSSFSESNSDKIFGANISNHTVDSLTAGTRYYFSVRSFIGSKESDDSDEVSGFPGGGSASCLTIAPALFDKTIGSAGQNIYESFNISNNNCGTNLKIRLSGSNIIGRAPFQFLQLH